jgi:hypothetical protein
MAILQITRKMSSIVRHIRTIFKKYILILHLIGDFIDDETPVASGSRTQQHTSWNTLQNGGDLDEFFAGIYQRSRSRRRTTVEVTSTDPHDCIRALPGAEEFPLWLIGCRVRLLHKKIEE